MNPRFDFISFSSRSSAVVSFSLCAAVLLAACGSVGGSKPGAVANLVPTAAITPNPTMGTVVFAALDRGVRIKGEVRGLVPGSEHGFHVHEKGDCASNGDASGGHFNPTGVTHGKFGAPGSHAGELPSLVADNAGVARFSLDDQSLSMTEGADNNVVGRALIVHRDSDDFTTQPSGNSGPRIACAIVTRS